MVRHRLLLRCLAAAGVVAFSTLGLRESRAQSTWQSRYDAAREDLVEGRYQKAELELRALAVEAPSPSARALALEMARLAAEYAERGAAGHATPAAPPRLGARGTRPRDIRSTDELTLLYASSFFYGAGTGTWFLLGTKPQSALAAILPFATLTAAPVIAVATVDGFAKLPRGLPHALSAGLYLGLGEGVWLVGYEHARAGRIAIGDPDSDLRWKPETVAAVLWSSATTGAVLGGLLGSSLTTTPGRVSFTASMAMWSSAVAGLGAAASMPDDAYRRERGFLAAGVGLNAGLVSGLLLAGPVSPSIARVRLVDLVGLAGAVVSSGLYLSLAPTTEPKAAEGFAAAGAVVGLSAGWLATSGMPKERPAAAPVAKTPTLEPSLTPLSGGATIGVGGTW